MTLSIALVLGIVTIAFLLFVTERVPIAQVALGIPAALIATGLLSPEQAVSGFASSATVTIACMLVLSLALTHTGVVRDIALAVQSVRMIGPTTRLALMTVLTCAVSPFLNNTAVVVVFLPVFVALAKADGKNPSLYLMPLSFSAILGGTITLIGTSTNLVVSGVAAKEGIHFTVFSITPIGLVVASVGMIYLWTVGRWLLPDRVADPELQSYGRRYSTELLVPEGNPLVGRNINELDWKTSFGCEILGLRHGSMNQTISDDVSILANDHILVRGETDELIALTAQFSLQRPGGPQIPGARVVEVLVAPGAKLIGQSIRQSRFEEILGCRVLAIQHGGEGRRRRMADLILRVGDILLVEGTPEALDHLVQHHGYVGLQEVEAVGSTRRGRLFAFGTMLAVVIVAGSGTLSVMAASILGAVAVVFAGCVHMEDVYEGLDWGVLFLLAGTIPLGIAMQTSGAAELLAQGIASLVGDAQPWMVVALIYGFTSLLTEVMSNNAAAILLTPIAISLSKQLGFPPEMLLVTVMFGASAAFMSPVGYQTNTMVYGPGGYRFSDYLRVGGLLNLILLSVISAMLPWFYMSAP